jgi:hypothetical protein
VARGDIDGALGSLVGVELLGKVHVRFVGFSVIGVSASQSCWMLRSAVKAISGKSMSSALLAACKKPVDDWLVVLSAAVLSHIVNLFVHELADDTGPCLCQILLVCPVEFFSVFPHLHIFFV